MPADFHYNLIVCHGQSYNIYPLSQPFVYKCQVWCTTLQLLDLMTTTVRLIWIKVYKEKTMLIEVH